MKLYKSFSGIDGKISVDEDSIEEVTSNIKTASKSVNGEKVIKWITKQNPDISKKKLEEFKANLGEQDVPSSSNKKTFYGHVEVRKFIRHIYSLFKLICATLNPNNSQIFNFLLSTTFKLKPISCDLNINELWHCGMGNFNSFYFPVFYVLQ